MVSAQAMAAKYTPGDVSLMVRRRMTQNAKVFPTDAITNNGSAIANLNFETPELLQ